MSSLSKTIFYVAVFVAGIIFPAAAQEQSSNPAIPRKVINPDALYIDAVRARMLGDDKQQEELLAQVIRLKPDEAAPYYDLARLYIKQGKIDQAEQNIKKTIARNSDNPWYQRQYAEILAYQNRFDSAAVVYYQLGKKEKHNHEFLMKAAMLYQRSGNYKEALTALDELIRKIGASDEMLLQKQQIYLRMNQLDGALKVAQELIEQNPREGKFYANLADLYESNDQPEKAIATYEKALKEFPNDPTLQYGLAEYYRKKKDTEKYDEYIRKAILNTEFDDETQTGILLGYLQEVSGDSVRRKEGEAIAAQLVAQHPGNAQITALYGQVLLNGEQNDKAVEQFKRSLAIDPSRFTIWQQIMLLYSAPKDADSLLKYSEKAMRYFPNQAMVHYLNGIGHFNRKSFPPAIKSIKRAVDLQPEDNPDLLADMYSSLGDIYNLQKEYTLSDSAYEQALRLNPTNATVLNNYSYYLSLRGVRLETAEKMSKKSLEIRPGEATFLDTYGWILYKRGKYDEAKKYIEDALKANPEADGTLWEHLGDVYSRLNETGKAVEYWKKAKEKGTDNPQIDKKIQDQKLYE